jgi:hypothetical protein
MKQVGLTLLVSLLFGISALAQSGSFSGRVTDQRTKEPLIGANIQLEETTFGSTTDIDGNYTIENVPARTYNIKASFVGYQSLIKFNVVIRSGGNIDVNFELVETTQELESVVVTANPFSKIEETPLSIQKLNQEEVASYPGGNNDIAKVVQSLPGVSGSVGGFRNDVIIRGGAPSENVYYLDAIEIPNINHFSTQGSAGGPVGLLNVSFFEGVTLTASSFGAQYDNVLSGVLQFDQRNGNERKFQGNVRVGASETALTLEGPLFKGKNEKSKTSFIASARRSYLQFLFDIIGLPILPDYWDYQYKLQHRIDDYNQISLLGLGSIDDFKVNELEEFDAEQQAVQDQVPIIRQRTNTFGLSWKKRFRDNSGFMQTSISNNLLVNDFTQYADNVNQTGPYFKNDSREQETKFRYVLTKFVGSWTLTFGTTLQLSNYSNKTVNLVNDFQYDTRIDFLKYGFFAQTFRKFASDRLGVSFGLRSDGNNFTKEGNDLQKTISPRMSISYQLDQKGKWTLNFSAGRYFKSPAYTVLGFRDRDGLLSNKAAKYTQSDHVVVGIERLLTESSRITIEGFGKFYKNYPVSVIDEVSLANKGGGFEVLGNEPVRFDGQGRTYGVEFLYQQKFNGRLYAILALTLYKSEFTNGEKSAYLPSSWDNGQLVSLTAGYKFFRNWEVSARFRFLGESPYAPVDVNATLATYPAVIRDYSSLGTNRLDAFQQLDFRVDKKWNFKRFSLDVYLDLQNALGAASPSEPSYGLNRDDQGNIVAPKSLVVVNTNETGTVLPSLGIVINF